MERFEIKRCPKDFDESRTLDLLIQNSASPRPGP
jgi:hypothetical protein